MKLDKICKYESLAMHAVSEKMKVSSAKLIRKVPKCNYELNGWIWIIYLQEAVSQSSILLLKICLAETEVHF